MSEQKFIHITSPEQLNNYIRATTPGVWLFLSAVLVLLAGFFLWIFTGRIEQVISVDAYTREGVSVAFLTIDDAGRVREGMRARVGGVSGKVQSISQHEEVIFRVVMLAKGAPEGRTKAEIVCGVVNPLSYLLK